MVTLLMALLADLVFESASTMRRSFDTDVDRYLHERGFHSAAAKKLPTR